MCAKFGTIVMANNDLAMEGGGTYETPYTMLNIGMLTERNIFTIIKYVYLKCHKQLNQHQLQISVIDNWLLAHYKIIYIYI